MGNIAYIDNQNLFCATMNAEEPWAVDMRRFRVYLERKLNVSEAYLFMGAYDAEHQDLYNAFQRFGYILVFRPHSPQMRGNKKGNVDTDVVFSLMRDIYERDDYDGAVLVSGDGDYFRTVEHLASKGRLARLVFPSRRTVSSLYQRYFSTSAIFLDDGGVKQKIERKQEAGPLR